MKIGIGATLLVVGALALVTAIGGATTLVSNQVEYAGNPMKLVGLSPVATVTALIAALALTWLGRRLIEPARSWPTLTGSTLVVLGVATLAVENLVAVRPRISIESFFSQQAHTNIVGATAVAIGLSLLVIGLKNKVGPNASKSPE